MDDSFQFSTPPVRTGPSSRLLRRRLSQVVNPEADKSMASVSQFDVTAFNRSQRTRLAQRSFLNDTEHSMLDLTKPAYMYTATGSAVSKETHVQLDHQMKSTANLFVDFFASCVNDIGLATEDDSQIGVLDQVAEFEQLLVDQVHSLNGVLDKAPKSSQKETVQRVSENLTKEVQSWRLIGKLFVDRLQRRSGADAAMGEDADGQSPMSRPLSEKEIVERLFQRDQSLREAQAIIDWLEMNAQENFNDPYAQSDIYGDSMLGWENTLHAMQTNQASAALVTELDPDAKLRQKRLLHDIDEQDQQRLAKILYKCLRAGLMETAENLCLKMGQPWRVATLNGWKLFHDPNVDMDSTTDKLPVEGNVNRDLWKSSAWTLSQDESMPAYERAIYSALCGNAHQLLTSGICSSWEDKLWALTRCLVDLNVEREIRGLMAKSFIELPNDYWKNQDNLSLILGSVNSLEQDNASALDSAVHHTIQSLVILQDWDRLYDHLVACAKTTTDPHLMRFLAHLVLVLRKLGLACERRDRDEDVLQAYIHYLFDSNRIQQVAWYISQQSEARQIEGYSGFIMTILSDSDRRYCLQLAAEHNLPLRSIRILTVDNLLALECEEDEDEKEHDLAKVSALDWLLLEPTEAVLALVKANGLVRRFIAEQKVEQAHRVLERLNQALPKFNLPADSPHLKEHLCLKAYVLAKLAFSDWFEHMHKGKPKRPEPLAAEKSSFTAQVASEERIKLYESEYERWNGALIVQSREVVAHLYNVLDFPDGWLVFSPDPDDLVEPEIVGSSRVAEVGYLRSLCLVEIVFLLHSVYHNTKQYKEAVQLADLVACSRRAIFTEFTKEDMTKLLQCIRESSVALMEVKNVDAWGY